MALKLTFNKPLVAKLVTSEAIKSCAFCLRSIDDESIYGKLYAIGDIQCHYFCVLLSCCLVQKGKDEEGLFGFLYKDILIELERIKKHKCSYCGQGGANLGCAVSSCRYQFHLPCGREKNALSLFYGTFKSYCQRHAPKQKLPEHILCNVKQRKKISNAQNNITSKRIDNNESLSEMVCVICYESVDGYPTLQTFWPPCCAKDAWFHRTCLQRMCLSAGMHYLKCPLCNDKNNFYDAVVSQGYYVPDRDAAWELEQNAFSEIYERPISCNVDECLCPMGRNHDGDTGEWELVRCLLCGSAGAHVHCSGSRTLVCRTCGPAAPTDLHALQQVILQEQAAAEATRRAPVMPSRMSLRRTKGRIALEQASTSRTTIPRTRIHSENTITSRQQLNLKSPQKRNAESKNLRSSNTLLSPLKLLEQGLKEKSVDIDQNIVDMLRVKFKKPRPLCVKKKIVDKILENMLTNVVKDQTKQKTPQKEWLSPKKCESDIKDPPENQPEDLKSPTKSVENPTNQESPTKNLLSIQSIMEIDTADDSSSSSFELPPEFIGNDSEDGFLFENNKTKIVNIEQNSSLEIFEKDESVNIDVQKITPVKEKKETSHKVNLKKSDDNLILDVEDFKKEYLSEVDRHFKCSFNHNHLNSNKNNEKRIKTAIDFAFETIKKENVVDVEKGGKRKLTDVKENEIKKKRRKVENEEFNDNNSNNSENRLKSKENVSKNKKLRKNVKKQKKNGASNSKKNIEVTIDSYEEENKKIKTKLSLKNKNIKLKIQWRKEKLHLKFESKKNNSKNNSKTNSKYKQCVLKYNKDNEGLTNEVLVRPEKEISLPKRKYVKHEKSPDKFKQMSLHSFFKVKSPNEK